MTRDRRRIHWLGRTPSAELVSKLRSYGLEPSARAEGALFRVIESRVVPRPPDRALPWIWVHRGTIEQAEAVEAVLQGAYDVLPLSSAEALSSRLKELLVPPLEPDRTDVLVGKSESSRRVLDQVARAARTSMPVLLTGETGTGKEVVARLIHEWSRRRKGRFVPINCAAIPNELMEAQLFGYARGAFSGAIQRYEGLLLAAEGGTVFLDEIDDTPLSLQVKLLRVLQDRVVSRLGENEWHEVDFRIIAATNRNLPRLIEAGLFGADLYERLAIVSVSLPRLRERLEDLPDLAQHFLEKFYRDEPEEARRDRVRSVSPRALEALRSYPWPGNVRELRNVIYEALVYKRAGDELLLSDLPRRLLAPEKRAVDSPLTREDLRKRMVGGRMNLRKLLEDVERMALEEALALSSGSPTRAARLLGEVGRGSSSDPGGTVRAMMGRLRSSEKRPGPTRTRTRKITGRARRAR